MKPLARDPAKTKPTRQHAVSESAHQSEAQSVLPDQRWRIYPALKGEANWLSHQVELSPLLAQVLLNRNIETPEAALEFLNPESLLLPSPLDEFPDLEQSIEILLQAIELGEKIAICGDYDADGMTSTALLMRALRYLGANVDYAIPSRMQEGYGINTRIVEEFFADGVSVILTVDNGIAAVEPIAVARELGITVIVTDHHDVPPEIPPAHAILNPKLIAEDSPYRGVAGVGVAYILAVCLAQAMGRIQDLTGPLLELFTLGTIADLAPLTGVNRRWVRRGLRLLPKSRLIGVEALIQVAGLGDENESLKPEDIGFKLGPRINAVGRIGDPQVVIEMLTTDDVDDALQRALECEQANQRRRDLCDRIEEDAIAVIEAEMVSGEIDLLRDRVLLLVQPDWHHGVIGIVASRLMERYGVPVFIGTYEDDAQKEIRGSARGTPEFNVFEALQSAHDLMGKFGGHKAAGGFSFPTKHLRQVRSRLVKFANQTLQPEHLKPLVTIDVRAALSDLTFDLYAQIDALHPCGIGNPDPVFWTPNVRVVEQRTMGQNNAHLKLFVAEDGGEPLAAIAWRWGRYCPMPNRIDIAYKLSINEWRGNTTLQLDLVGVRPATQRETGPATVAAQASKSATLQLPLVPPDAASVSSPARSPRPPTTSAPPPRAAESTAANLGVSERAAIAPSETQATPANQADFFYSHRRYQARTFKKGTSRELQIHNPEGQVLVVLLPEKQGFLCLPGEPPRAIDLGEHHYFNLVRAGLDALEIRQQSHLLLAKEELLVDKDQHIATLTEQIAFLQAKVGEFSQSQQAQFQTLQAEVKAQETAIQNQEAHIETLKQDMPRPASTLDPKAIKGTVKAAVGDAIWFLLQSQSQKDLYAAYKQLALNEADGTHTQTANYSEAGLRLGAAVEREVMQPCVADLSTFLQANDTSTLGSIQFGAETPVTLHQLAALLAKTWTSLQPPALKSAAPPDDDRLYHTVNTPVKLSRSDRTRLNNFLKQWEHPMGEWFRRDAPAVASHLDQLGQLQALAADPSAPLYLWAFEKMRDLVVGSDQQRGLFQHIYGKK